MHPVLWRAALFTAIALVACDGGSSGPDASVVDEPGSGSGSGTAFDGADPNPPDGTLEWIVVGLSVVVVGGSVRSRRRDAKTYEL